MAEIALPPCGGGSGWGLCVQSFAYGSKIGRFIRRVERPFLTKPFDSDPSHEAGERGESPLLRMRRYAGQFENLVGHRLIDLRRGDRGPAGFGRVGEPAAQRLEPGVHLFATVSRPHPALPRKRGRVTEGPTLPSPTSGGGLARTAALPRTQGRVSENAVDSPLAR